MAFQPLTDGLRCVLEWGGPTVTWTNTLYFTRPNYTLAEQQVMVDLVMDEFENLADEYLSLSWELKNVVGYDVRSISGPVLNTLRAPHPGTRTGTAAPLNVAGVITLRTAVRGKSGRGRMYLAGWSESDVGPSAITDPSVFAGINAQMALTVAVWNANGWSWVVASGQQSGVVLPELVPYEITAAEMRNDILATQRRRIDRP